MWNFDSTGSLQRTNFWSSLCSMSSKAEPGGLRCKRDSQLLHRQQAKVSHPHERCMLTTSSTKRAVKILSIQGWILAIHFSFFSRCLAFFFFFKWSKLKTILLWIKKKRKTWREKKDADWCCWRGLKWVRDAEVFLTTVTPSLRREQAYCTKDLSCCTSWGFSKLHFVNVFIFLNSF